MSLPFYNSVIGSIWLDIALSLWPTVRNIASNAAQIRITYKAVSTLLRQRVTEYQKVYMALADD